MADERPPVGPPIDEIESVFTVYETHFEKDHLIYFGEATVPHDGVIDKLAPRFHEYGYHLEIRDESPDTVLVAHRNNGHGSGARWLGVGLLAATGVTTLMAGAMHYGVTDPWQSPHTAALTAWPFAIALLGILGIHEFAHYVVARYHRVRVSLPYFIPLPNLIGTLGAVIRVEGRIPDRDALFDIGVAGPLAGFVVAVGISAIGLVASPITLSASNTVSQYRFGYPLVFHGLAWMLNQPLVYPAPKEALNPLVIAGWVGVFITFLNLLPVGQLDGGHMSRAMLGRWHAGIEWIVPVGLFGLTAWTFLQKGVSAVVLIWLLWGVITVVLAGIGATRPMRDGPLSRSRLLLGIATVVVGVACFTPIPIMPP